ncbi:MAG: 2-C-methyl-D-erythritol 4-phosphate cytidylyltransferase [gamma proteobacterium symbiont of Bathyaustriella thionipta]|nr:2-C-methyl-D-erythritol 4-phosphate cytidylyltransferase [gamma proteobacterium symbiont of Bathyaustriella thionipta]
MSAAGRPQIHAIIPAAGIGSRMRADRPKQYLRLYNKRLVIEQTLERLLSVSGIHEVLLVLSATDDYFNHCPAATDSRIRRINGGRQRCHSVMNALQAIPSQAAEQDWVLVHDAARPCVRVTDIEKLLQQGLRHASGALLAMPVRDSMKLADEHRQITQSLPREYMWHALTPQLFPLRLLQSAMQNALDKGQAITDEASAMQYAGHRPLLIEGATDNIKITHPQDLLLADFYLQHQEQHT